MSDDVKGLSQRRQANLSLGEMRQKTGKRRPAETGEKTKSGCSQLSAETGKRKRLDLPLGISEIS